MYSIAHMATAGITALNVTVGDEVAGGAAASNGNTGENSSIVGTASTSGYGNMTLSAFAGGQDLLRMMLPEAVEAVALGLLVLMLLALLVEQVVSLLLLEGLQVVTHQVVKVATVEVEP